MAKLSNFRRIVIVQRRNGFVCDVGEGSALTPRLNVGQEDFRTAAGTIKPVVRNRELVIPVFDEDKLGHLRVMEKEGCEVRAILVGDKSHIIWELDSELNITDFRQAPGGITGANVRLNTDLFYGSIYQSENILDGIPWDCETAVQDGASYYFSPTGWQGNRWLVSSGDLTDGAGNYTGSSSPQLEMYFPLSGATISLEGTWTGNVKTLDYSGATLTTTSKTLSGTPVTAVIDDETWILQVNVFTATKRPIIKITDPGDLDSNRTGGCIDCSDPTATESTAPGWSS